MPTKKSQHIFKKPKKGSFAHLLYNDNFTKKKIVEKNSVTELSGLKKLNEKMILENMKISYSKENSTTVVGVDENSTTVGDNNFNSVFTDLSSLNYNLSIPPRIPYNSEIGSFYKEIETAAFNQWKLNKGNLIFERNIEVWRQFWLVCERADTIAQVVDTRNYEKFINFDIFEMYPNKKHVLLMNKNDLIKNNNLNNNLSELFKNNRIDENNRVDDLMDNVDAYYYSTVQKGGNEISFNYKFKGVVVLIGYPNVGKSSTINLILKHKKVKVSSVPGKTKWIQTIETEDFTLLDCPGLVFPKHTKVDLILMGVLNPDQIFEVMKYGEDIVSVIGRKSILRYFNKKESGLDDNVLNFLSEEMGWTKSKCLKTIIKAYTSGEIRKE